MIEMTTTARGTQTPRLRGANLDRISSATKRAVWGGWTPDADNAPEFELARDERGETTEDLLDLVPVTEEPPVRMATAGQVRFMESLARQVGIEFDGSKVPFADVNKELARLKALPRATQPAAKELEDGVYLFGDTYYMLQHAVHGSGRQYAKVITPPAVKGDRATAEYAGTAPLRHLTPDMKLTADQAAVFGEVYGCCVSCFRPLTDERSKAVGYGQTCASNNGWTWG